MKTSLISTTNLGRKYDLFDSNNMNMNIDQLWYQTKVDTFFNSIRVQYVTKHGISQHHLNISLISIHFLLHGLLTLVHPFKLTDLASFLKHQPVRDHFGFWLADVVPYHVFSTKIPKVMQTMQRSLYEFKYKYRSRMLTKSQELRIFLERKNTSLYIKNECTRYPF